MSTTTLRKMYVGLDVHKDTIVVAVADGNGSEARSFGTIGNNTADLDRLLRRLTAAHPGRRWIFGYEAGPCGYPLAARPAGGDWARRFCVELQSLGDGQVAGVGLAVCVLHRGY